MKKKLISVLLACILAFVVAVPALATSTIDDYIIVDGIKYLPRDTYWANTYTEVEYLGNGKYGATIYSGHQVFFDEADNNTPKKHKLTNKLPNYVTIQSAQVCTEIYPYYAKYYDVQYQEVRLEEERWVVQRLFKEPDTWRDVGAWNPVMVVEEYEEATGHTIKVTITYNTDFGILVVEYLQREGSPLKHNVYFTNTSDSTQTFRVLQKWTGIAGSKVNNASVVTAVTTDEPYLTFHDTDKPSKEFNISENLYRMIYTDEVDLETGESIVKADQCLQRPVTIETSASGLKVDFIYGNWVLTNNAVLEIDPATATLANPTEDASIRLYEGAYNRTLEPLKINILAYPPTGVVWRGFVEWDVSSIPDAATITDTVFKYHGGDNKIDCHIHEMLGARPSTETDANVYAEAGEGTIYADPDGFPVVGINQQVDLGASANSDLQAQLAANDWFAIGFQSDNEASDGYNTYIRSEEYASTPDPTLYVEYTASASPSVTTNAATYVAKYSARLNSTLVGDGGEACDVRFQYYTGAGDWPDNETAWVNDTYLTGNTPWVDISSLAHTTLYHFRVQGRNDFGGGAIISGASVDFTTEAAVAVCANFKAYPVSTTVGLTWTKGVGATNTMIRYSEVTYPTDQTEGTHSYTGPLASHTITGLTAGHTYYIVAISNSGADYSAPVEVLATTTAGGAVEDEPTDPTMPTGWFQSPDHTGLSGLPLYDQMNDLFDAFDIPPESGWFFSAILVCVILGAVVFVISRHPTPAVITLAVAMAIASLIKLLPLYMMVFSVVFIIGVWQLGRES